MNAQTQRLSIAGPSGALECAIDAPAGTARALALVCHPHPQHGGTMDNKVVRTLARAFTMLGCTAVRFNFRGVGASAGTWAEGPGEIDDALAVVDALRTAGQPLVLAGFSFGGYVAAHAAARRAPVERLVLVGPAVSRFELPPVPADTLVIHGEHDDVVPLASVFDWARPQPLPVVVIPGAGHFFHGQLPLLKSLVVGAFAR
jgi:alpha/beta superfamily hydrolase